MADWRGLGNPTSDHAACGVGAIVDLTGSPSHSIVDNGLTLLNHLDHRAARCAEEKTGDGAGILFSKPHDLFADTITDLPAFEDYAVGHFFMPRDETLKVALINLIEQIAHERHFTLLAWRPVPVEPNCLGRTALALMPEVIQLFISPVLRASPSQSDANLYLLRRVIERQARNLLGLTQKEFYVCSLDRQVIVYKGMLTCGQLPVFYPDLVDPRVMSSFVLIHSRFSTNTLGAWHLAHPCRNTVHNGEFNTIRGNENWMRAREKDLASPLFGDDIDLIYPVVEPEASDTAKFDNVLELLLVSGWSMPRALRMMIPEAWEANRQMSQERREFYDFHSTIMEPWDGPALVVATDGAQIAAALDRNGFRPCRYCVTRENQFVLASETGVLDIDDADVITKGRLKPGQLLVVDTQQGQVLANNEVFSELVDASHGKWLREQRLRLPHFTPAPSMTEATGHLHRPEQLQQCQRLFGYNRETLEYLLVPMAEESRDPMGAMGSDTPLAALSRQPQNLSSYFQQLFAQVSNPPLDFIRERLVTSLRSHIGRKRNLLLPGPAHCHQVLLETPILTEWELEALKNIEEKEIRAKQLDMTFSPEKSLDQAIDNLVQAARTAINNGYEILVLSDRRAGANRIPLPSLLAVGSVHQMLIRWGIRTRAGIVLDAGEPVTVHQFCCLFGYGADAVHPWLAFETLNLMVARKEIEASLYDAHHNFREAIEYGLLKVMSKMGISTFEGYKGAQAFESIGLDSALVGRFFTGTPAHLPGVGLSDIESGLRRAHKFAFDPAVIANLPLPSGGTFYWRRDGEQHEWNPFTVAKLQQAARTGDRNAYRSFSRAIQELDQQGQHIRGLLEFAVRPGDAINLDEVEPVASIIRRFSTGSMSFGALSQEAHETLAVAMNRLGGISGTGEGGEQTERFGTERSCSMKQIASGRFGVTHQYLADAKQIEIKMAQGSKPGEGGELPGAKVDEGIAQVRYSTPGIGLISPPPHHDIYSIEDLAQLIFDLKCANPAADIHVKLVACNGVGTIAAGVAKARADAVLISGSSGGTGASIKTSIKHAGAPWELGLAEAHQVLLANRLRSSIRLRVDGGFKTGRDVVVGALLGGEEFGFGTAPLIALGCIMLRKCHCNTCSVGVATQDKRLRARFRGEPEHVINYLTCVAEEVRELMAIMGFRKFNDMIGRVDKLRSRQYRFDLTRLLYRPPPGDSPRQVKRQDHGIDRQQEWQLLDRIEPAVLERRPISFDVDVSNRDRAFGTLTSYCVTRKAGKPLPPATITLNCTGHGGQSFGAFLTCGIALHLRGDTNDYFGKGLSGGRLSIRIPENAGFDAEDATICGNVALYGATAGEAYIAGVAGERFAVRNSGAMAVVEGLGDHGCEYMTGGIVVILGSIGRNFASGMSGGEVYLFDKYGLATSQFNQEGINVHPIDPTRGEPLVKRLLGNHLACTGSARAKRLLQHWHTLVEHFVVVIPDSYERLVTESLAIGEDARPKKPSIIQMQQAAAGGS